MIIMFLLYVYGEVGLLYLCCFCLGFEEVPGCCVGLGCGHEEDFPRESMSPRDEQ